MTGYDEAIEVLEIKAKVELTLMRNDTAAWGRMQAFKLAADYLQQVRPIVAGKPSRKKP